MNPTDAPQEVASLLDDWLASVGDGEASPADGVEPSLGGAPPEAGTATLIEALHAEAALLPAGVDTALAAPSPETHARRLVLFTAGPSTYGVPDTFVTEVGRVPKITAVPHVPGWLRGVTNLRGDVMSVIDLRTLLGLEAAVLHSARLLVVRLVDEDFSLALLVDAVDRIASVPPDAVRPPASPLEGALATYLTGVCQLEDRLVGVLDLDRLLRSPEIRQFDDRNDAEPSA